jgi:signal transduction histidine kinase
MVTDTGSGINELDQMNLFQEFVQVNASKLQKGQGSGLGLWSKFLSVLYISLSYFDL